MTAILRHTVTVSHPLTHSGMTNYLTVIPPQTVIPPRYLIR
ncbi:hypothetical protein [Wolbachia pipientis]|nr:hypothetical protein [Wolbachia pipientis]